MHRTPSGIVRVLAGPLVVLLLVVGLWGCQGNLPSDAGQAAPETEVDDLSADEAEQGTEGEEAEAAPVEAAQTELEQIKEILLPREAREIVCWGDSMTAGYGVSPAIIEREGVSYDASYQAYPEVLRRITGMDVYNFGVSGATSAEIVAMQADVEPPAGEWMPCFDVGIAQCASRHPGDILILEIGSNGGWDEDYDVLIAQYRSMIERSGCEDYLIIGDTDDPGTSPADPLQEPFWEGGGQTDTDWEAALRAEFGSHFINMRRYLIRYGLRTTGLAATDEDLELAERGCISPQLRSDWTHLNSYGYYAKARGVYRRGVKLGYWD